MGLCRDLANISFVCWHTLVMRKTPVVIHLDILLNINLTIFVWSLVLPLVHRGFSFYRIVYRLQYVQKYINTQMGLSRGFWLKAVTKKQRRKWISENQSFLLDNPGHLFLFRPSKKGRLIDVFKEFCFPWMLKIWIYSKYTFFLSILNKELKLSVQGIF